MKTKITALFQKKYINEEIKDIKFIEDPNLDIQKYLNELRQTQQYIFDYSTEKVNNLNILKFETDKHQKHLFELNIFKILDTKQSTTVPNKYKCSYCNGTGYLHSSLNNTIDENHPLIFCKYCQGKKIDFQKIEDEKKEIAFSKQQKETEIKNQNYEKNLLLLSNSNIQNEFNLEHLDIPNFIYNLNTHILETLNNSMLELQIKDYKFFNIKKSITLLNQIKYTFFLTDFNEKINIYIPYYNICYFTQDFYNKTFELSTTIINDFSKKILTILKQQFKNVEFINSYFENKVLKKGKNYNLENNKLYILTFIDKFNEKIKLQMFFEFNNIDIFKKQKQETEVENEVLLTYKKTNQKMDFANNLLKEGDIKIDLKLFNMIEINVYENTQKKEIFFNNLKK
jgi:hypothetical protein